MTKLGLFGKLSLLRLDRNKTASSIALTALWLSAAFAFRPLIFLFFFQAEDGIRDWSVTGVKTCALPIDRKSTRLNSSRRRHTRLVSDWSSDVCSSDRSEEHTSELQSLTNLVCRLLLGVQTCALPIDRKSTRLNSSH